MGRNVYIVGTAGCGKTTLTYAFQLWMARQGFDAITVNLDPGAESLPYEPDIDIRDWIRLSDVMREYNLGPNGAQVVAADMLALNSQKISKVLEDFRTDYILLDTPGQMELFAFRESSRAVIEAFGEEDSIIMFLFDPALAKEPSGLVALMMLSLTTHFRFPIPLANILAKSDLLSDDQIEDISEWSGGPESLYSALTSRETSPENIPNVEFLRAMENVGAYQKIIPVSSETFVGLEDVYSRIQLCFEAGEDLSSD